MSDEIVKVCDRHGKLTAKDAVLRKNYKAISCRICIRESSKKYARKEEVKVRAKERHLENKKCYVYLEKRKNNNHKRKLDGYTQYKIYRKNNIDIIRYKDRERSAKIRKERPEYIKARSKKYTFKCKENISDSYVRKILLKNTYLKAADIPTDLIEAKRIQLKIKRELIKIKQGEII